MDPEPTATGATLNAIQRWLRRRPLWVRRAITAVMLGLVFLAVAPLIAPTFHVSFIASPQYAAQVWPDFALIGFALGLGMSFQMAKYPSAKQSGFKKALAVIFAPILLASFFHTAARDGISLLIATAIHNETSLVFTVKHHKPGYSKGCPSGIDFQEFFMAKLCNQPDSLRDTLHDGQRVALHGYGTSWGIFVDHIEPLPN